MNEGFRFEDREPIEAEYKTIKDEEAREVRSVGKNPLNFRTNIILFVITLFTTTYAGAMLEVGFDPVLALIYLHKGFPFSLTLLTILLFHEFGHYFTAKKHHVETTLPYFIPAPTFIGTFGAVIKMRSPVHSKRTLLDIGAAGPLAGVFVAIPATIIGLRLSKILPLSGLEGGMSLGSSLLFSLLAYVSVGDLPQNHDIFLHPIAFAGWIGLLVTMLNLLPVGQLDGGHIAYAVLGRERHQKIASLILPVLLIFGLLPVPELMLPVFHQILLKIGFLAVEETSWWILFQDGARWLAGYGWIGWLIWSLILRFLIRTTHPATVDEYLPLNTERKVIGWIALVLFILTFTPSPFHITF